ncbi:MAG: HD domain-containing protein [Syntrophobacterales bacterium]|nr:HD domain-containing protein [Syntrophobacterales bacterium]
MAKLACAMAEEMGFSEEQIGEIRLVALVHDIGKISVSADLLTRSDGLMDNEYMLIKNHRNYSGSKAQRHKAYLLYCYYIITKGILPCNRELLIDEAPFLHSLGRDNIRWVLPQNRHRLFSDRYLPCLLLSQVFGLLDLFRLLAVFYLHPCNSFISKRLPS